MNNFEKGDFVRIWFTDYQLENGSEFMGPDACKKLHGKPAIVTFVSKFSPGSYLVKLTVNATLTYGLNFSNLKRISKSSFNCLEFY